MINSIREWFSIQIAKKPGRMVIFAILSFNIVFFLIAALIISNLALEGTETMNFFDAAFCTITMILDPGCIQFVIQDIGKSGVLITIVCLIVIFVGMVSFTGAVIGYTTNYIADFISTANAGSRKLNLSNHVVILNWNTRASEIINDLMYCETKQKVVVLVKSRKEEIEKEIIERLTDTINKENKNNEIRFAKNYAQRITVIVREGDVFSSKQLHDISLEKAKSIIILGDDYNDEICVYRNMERSEELNRGNSLTIKTLMQVADITAAESSYDAQKVIVEITDEWTWEIVNRIIEHKQVAGKCNIVPVRVNKVLGQLLSQFSVMPELNAVYSELLSNKGMAFYPIEATTNNEEDDFRNYINTHTMAIPLSYMESQGKSYCYYAAENEKDINKESIEHEGADITVSLNEDYWLDQKNVIILGHNSKLVDIMDGFAAFRVEWAYPDSNDEILRILVIDDQRSLDRMNNYAAYPFVIDTVAADIYDKELICSTIERFVDGNREDTSVLILSDDNARSDEIDAEALANLIYVQDIIYKKKNENPDFDEKSIDPIVEIIDPKHHDIVGNYSVNNVVISNRYISKMLTQIGEKDALFDFYTDILTYDTDISEGFVSKEVYVKKVSKLFNEIPAKCTAKELICATYTASVDKKIPLKKRNPTIVLGYIDRCGEMTLFKGNQSEIEVELKADDLLIVYSNH